MSHGSPGNLRPCILITMTTTVPSRHKNSLTLSAYWGMRALVLIGTIVYVIQGSWASAFSTLLIFLLMFVPSILKEKYRFYLPFALDLGIVTFIFLTFFLGHMGSFYGIFPQWDTFLHFQSGLLLGASGFVLVYTLNEHTKTKLGLSPFFVAIFAVCFSLALGAVWEIFEFAGDAYFSTRVVGYLPWQASNADTMWDLIADSAGALVMSTYGYFWMRHHNRLPLTPWKIHLFRKSR